MKVQKDILTGTQARFSRVDRFTCLSRRDLISYEPMLAEGISRFLSFKSYSLYFPRSSQGPEPQWIGTERKLLLPLCLNGKLLAVFVARGVSLKAPKTMLGVFQGMAELVLEKLLLHKISISDPVTGLYSRQYLQSAMCREVDLIRECFRPSSDGRCDLVTVGHRACMGVVVVNLEPLKRVIRDHGYLFADRMALELADTLREAMPEQAIGARTGDFEFTVFLPTGTPKTCRKLAKKVALALRSARVTHEVTDEQVGVTATAGYATYPQDMEGFLFEKPLEEQTRLLLRKARIAASIVAEHVLGDVMDYTMGYNRILADGGKVQEVLPMNRLQVSIGQSMGAREGQRFSVWATQYGSRAGKDASPMYKGEVVLMDVRETDALAEVMHLGDPTWPVNEGDHISLLPDEQSVSAPKDGSDPQVDPLTGLLRHRDFLARLTLERENADAFSLCLLRLAEGEKRRGSKSGEQLMAEAADICRDVLGSDAIGGRYGINSLVYLHCGEFCEDLQARYTELCTLLDTKLSIDAAVGISNHPFLRYRKADSLDNCLKALEYAMLLPAPRVGIMNSLALNISADKMYSKGDTFGAIEEYKRALLADGDNTMAWNSLGVCHAGLGRPHDARSHFDEALARDAGDVMALYNLGHVCHTLGELDEARKHYKKCLKKDSSHVFALIRLGQIAEREKKYGSARQYYNKAAKLEENQTLVQRHLARLCLRQDKADEAREHLHQALLYNPQDAIALQLMARLYMDGGDDPEVAQVLARQAVALRPELKAGWLELSRALEALGLHKESRDALMKAGEL